MIVENEYPHSAINLIANASHRIYHANETDRHSDEYTTPISSPRLQQQHQQPTVLPQKLTNTTNATSMTQAPPTGITLTQPTVPLPAVSPTNSTQNQVSSQSSLSASIHCKLAQTTNSMESISIHRQKQPTAFHMIHSSIPIISHR